MKRFTAALATLGLTLGLAAGPSAADKPLKPDAGVKGVVSADANVHGH